MSSTVRVSQAQSQTVVGLQGSGQGRNCASRGRPNQHHGSQPTEKKRHYTPKGGESRQKTQGARGIPSPSSGITVNVNMAVSNGVSNPTSSHQQPCDRGKEQRRPIQRGGKRTSHPPPRAGRPTGPDGGRPLSRGSGPPSSGNSQQQKGKVTTTTTVVTKTVTTHKTTVKKTAK